MDLTGPYLVGPGYSIKQAAPIPVPMHMETTPNALKIVITKLYMFNLNKLLCHIIKYTGSFVACYYYVKFI